jgi:hypothetical protein
VPLGFPEFAKESIAPSFVDEDTIFVEKTECNKVTPQRIAEDTILFLSVI